MKTLAEENTSVDGIAALQQDLENSKAKYQQGKERADAAEKKISLLEQRHTTVCMVKATSRDAEIDQLRKAMTNQTQDKTAANKTISDLNNKLKLSQAAEATAKAEVKRLNEEMDMILKEVEKLKGVRRGKMKASDNAEREQRKKAKTVG